MMTRRKWVRLVKIIIIIYCLIGIGMFMLQDYFILHPVKLGSDYKYDFNIPFKEVNLSYDATTNINIIQFLPAQKVPKGILLYFHGNRTNISRYKRFAPFFTRSGYEVWMIDYPGYGKSTGTFSEKRVYEWALLMYKLARSRFAADHIIIYGKSLGTGIAAQLAAVRNCRYLILESPYYSLPNVVGFYAPIYPVNRIIHYKFPTFEYLPKVTDPVIIMHGTDDWVIPYNNAVKLSRLLKPTDRFLTVPGGTHRNLYTFREVPQMIDSLLGSPQL